MTNRTGVIARYTVLEAVRTRLPLLAFVVAIVLLAASFFVREIAVIESARFQTAFYAVVARVSCVIMVALYVISSVTREFQDKGLDLVLALDIPRSHYILGKLVGFVFIAAAAAVIASLPLAGLAGVLRATQWTISLTLELAIVVAVSLFCVVTFNHLMPAFSFVLAFYVLARAITAIRLISGNPIADAGALSHQVMARLIEALALLMPALDSWTQTAWLLDQRPHWSTLLGLAAHTALFVLIFASAAVFDMQRRNL
jgi:hypothetical protein